MGGLKIAKKLNEMGIRTAQGNLWTSPRIKELLSNEKYVGDMLLQKYFRNNHIEKRKMQNNGELPKYLQGYKYSKPIPIEQLTNFLNKKTV